MTELLDLKNALDIYQTQYTQVDKLWGYFATFTLAILGFTIGSEKATKSIKEVAAIIIGYLVFCIGNFRALQLGQKQLLEFAQLATSASEHAKLKLVTLKPMPIDSITWYYWCVVTAVCFGIIFIALKRQRHASTS